MMIAIPLAKNGVLLLAGYIGYFSDVQQHRNTWKHRVTCNSLQLMLMVTVGDDIHPARPVLHAQLIQM